MKFHYTGVTENDKRIEGNEEANSTAELLSLLASKSIKPISVQAVKEGFDNAKQNSVLRSAISVNDKIFLTKYLAIMLKVGIDLFQAVTILLSDFKQPGLKALLSEIRDNLEKGQPFYSTFSKYPRYFSPVFVNLVKAGESSGNLDMVFENLSVSFGKEKELRGKIKAALVYPIMLFALSIVILLVLTTFALPKLANVFFGNGFNPPVFTKVVFGVGLFINDHVFLIGGILGAIVIALIIASRTAGGIAMLNRMLLKTPIIKTIKYNLALQRFATTLSSLLKAGVPILEALRITADTIGHPDLTASLKRISDEGIARGLTLGDAFYKEKSFPAVVTNLVAISEKAGHLDEILETLGRFYESEIDGSIKNAITFIEPVLLLVIGVVIGTIALAVIVPIYQLVGQF
jgi:type II secretory pathway component PulF